jgi:tetratricopeptide (TPR) repeat protein
MKFKITLLYVCLLYSSYWCTAQSNSEFIDHYKMYYAQMQKQGDVQGIINAMTHLLVLEPNVARKDTLAAYYMNEGKYLQALNLLGIEKDTLDSNMALEVKAVSLKSLNELARALEQYELLFKRLPTASLAYELADLKISTNDIMGANLNITYGIANSTEQMMKPYYETQTPYQVPLKVGFMYLKAIAKFRENPEKNHEAAIELLDATLAVVPNFNLATLAKNAIASQKLETDTD